MQTEAERAKKKKRRKTKRKRQELPRKPDVVASRMVRTKRLLAHLED